MAEYGEYIEKVNIENHMKNVETRVTMIEVAMPTMVKFRRKWRKQC